MATAWSGMRLIHVSVTSTLYAAGEFTTWHCYEKLEFIPKKLNLFEKSWIFLTFMPNGLLWRNVMKLPKNPFCSRPSVQAWNVTDVC